MHLAWNQDPDLVGSLLSLDISGAFDKVSHPRLLHNLRDSKLPSWTVKYIQSFLQDRHTSLVLGDFKDSLRPTDTGIPQGSSLSPMLFLFFASGLLPLLTSGTTSAMGFVDDTNIITFSKTTEENCTKLGAAHQICLDWAARHGATFAPEKYQLIHLTRRPKKHNMQATVDIQGFTEGPSPSVRLLGVHLDPKLRWGPHIKQVQARGITQMASLQRLTKSTWGATFSKARHLYTAIVRPTLSFGAPIWATPEGTKGHSVSLVKPLTTIQNQCLRTIAGAYKSTPIPVLEHETSIIPLDLYLQQLTFNHVTKSKDSQVYKATQDHCTSLKALLSLTQAARKRGRRKGGHIAQALEGTDATRSQQTHKVLTQQRPAALRTWEKRWDTLPRPPSQASPLATRVRNQTRRPLSTARASPWNLGRIGHHTHLTRPQSTLATLLRTEHIGLRDYLFRRRVPGIMSSACTCGFQKQDPKHILLFCPELVEGRAQMLRQAGTSNLHQLLSTNEGIKASTSWLLKKGILGQFRLAQEMEERGALHTVKEY